MHIYYLSFLLLEYFLTNSKAINPITPNHPVLVLVVTPVFANAFSTFVVGTCGAGFLGFGCVGISGVGGVGFLGYGSFGISGIGGTSPGGGVGSLGFGNTYTLLVTFGLWSKIILASLGTFITFSSLYLDKSTLSFILA